MRDGVRLALVERVPAVVRDGAWTLVAQVGTKINVLVMLGAFASALGVLRFGQLAAWQAAALLGQVVSDLGFSAATQRLWASNVPFVATGWRRMLTQRAFAAALGVGTCLGLGFASSRVITPGIAVAACGYQLLLFANYWLQGAAFADRRFAPASKINGLGHGFGSLLLLLIFIAPVRSVGGGLALLVVIELLVAVGLLAEGRVRLRARISRRESMEPGAATFAALGLRRTAPYAAPSALSIASNRADSAVTGLFTTPHVVGLYAPASQAQNAIVGLALTLSSGLVSHTARARAASADTAQAVRAALKAVAVASVLLGALVLLFLPVFRSVFGSFRDSTVPIAIFAATGFLPALAGTLEAYLVGLSRPASVTSAWAASTLTFLAAQAVLTSRLGATGAALAGVVRDGILLAALAAIVRRTALPRRRPRGRHAKLVGREGATR